MGKHRVAAVSRAYKKPFRTLRAAFPSRYPWQRVCIFKMLCVRHINAHSPRTFSNPPRNLYQTPATFHQANPTEHQTNTFHSDTTNPTFHHVRRLT